MSKKEEHIYGATPGWLSCGEKTAVGVLYESPDVAEKVVAEYGPVGYCLKCVEARGYKRVEEDPRGRVKLIRERLKTRKHLYENVPGGKAQKPLQEIADKLPEDVQFLLDRLQKAEGAMESVLMQAGYTCLSAYEELEGFLGVDFDGKLDKFVYPDGKPINGNGREDL